MPLTSVVCCKGGEVPLEECLEHAASRTNSCNFTHEVLAAMFSTVQNRGDRISTTTLTTKCIRQEHLTRKEPYTVEPGDLWAAFRGTMFHGRLEEFHGPGTIPEARYHAYLPWDESLPPLTGSPDLVDVQRGILYDYKFSKEVPRWDKVWSDHEAQLNVNRWLVDHAFQVEWQGNIYLLDDPDDPDCDPGKWRPVDWQELIIVYMDDKTVKPIVVMESVDVPKVGGKGTKKARFPAVWSDERVEAYIKEHYEDARKALVENQLPDIPVGFENQAHPLCAYCPKRQRCRELELVQILSDAQAQGVAS